MDGVVTVPPVISNRALAYWLSMFTSLFSSLLHVVSPFARRWPMVSAEAQSLPFGRVEAYEPPVMNTSAG